MRSVRVYRQALDGLGRGAAAWPRTPGVVAVLLNVAEVAAIGCLVAWGLGVGPTVSPPAAVRGISWPPLLVVTVVVAVAVAVRVTVGGLLVRGTWRVLQGRVVSARQSQDRLSRALVDAVDAAQAQERARAQLTHDARNAGAGVRASLELLLDHGPELDEETNARLRQIALFGLAHLEEVVSRTDPHVQDFDVAEVVSRVVGGRRLLGAGVAVLGADVRAHGRPHDLATAVLNLLVNAERYAPGTPVSVDITRRGDQVRICVADGGPGIAPGCEEAIFARGWHTEDGPGQGLGLYTARELMRHQGGDLTLIPSTHGAAFMLTLPTTAGGGQASALAPGVREPFSSRGAAREGSQ